jgi:hypothetical protein
MDSSENTGAILFWLNMRSKWKEIIPGCAFIVVSWELVNENCVWVRRCLSLDRTLDGKLQQNIMGEILKYQLVQICNVASMWELNITCESMVNKHEVKRQHGIDMDSRKYLFIYFKYII